MRTQALLMQALSLALVVDGEKDERGDSYFYMIRPEKWDLLGGRNLDFSQAIALQKAPLKIARILGNAGIGQVTSGEFIHSYQIDNTIRLLHVVRVQSFSREARALIYPTNIKVNQHGEQLELTNAMNKIAQGDMQPDEIFTQHP